MAIIASGERGMGALLHKGNSGPSTRPFEGVAGMVLAAGVDRRRGRVGSDNRGKRAGSRGEPSGLTARDHVC